MSGWSSFRRRGPAEAGTPTSQSVKSPVGARCDAVLGWSTAFRRERTGSSRDSNFSIREVAGWRARRCRVGVEYRLQAERTGSSWDSNLGNATRGDGRSLDPWRLT